MPTLYKSVFHSPDVARDSLLDLCNCALIHSASHWVPAVGKARWGENDLKISPTFCRGRQLLYTDLFSCLSCRVFKHTHTYTRTQLKYLKIRFYFKLKISNLFWGKNKQTQDLRSSDDIESTLTPPIGHWGSHGMRHHDLTPPNCDPAKFPQLCHRNAWGSGGKGRHRGGGLTLLTGSPWTSYWLSLCLSFFI